MITFLLLLPMFSFDLVVVVDSIDWSNQQLPYTRNANWNSLFSFVYLFLAYLYLHADM